MTTPADFNERCHESRAAGCGVSANSADGHDERTYSFICPGTKAAASEPTTVTTGSIIIGSIIISMYYTAGKSLLGVGTRRSGGFGKDKPQESLEYLPALFRLRAKSEGLTGKHGSPSSGFITSYFPILGA